MKLKHFWYICFLFVVVIIVSHVNTLQHNLETFTPKIRAFYRPLVRQTRIVGEGFYNKSSSNISNLFRKFGIM